jgi:hypothetical protein
VPAPNVAVVVDGRLVCTGALEHAATLEATAVATTAMANRWVAGVWSRILEAIFMVSTSLCFSVVS